ncbi:MAG: hypothetical protein O3B47_00360 [bacterium]|nr:hypothetical protein [bacterium]
MIKTKNKNIARSTIKILLISLVVSLSTFSGVSYAAGECPKVGNVDGTTSDKGKTCSYASEVECPNTYTGKKATPTVCTKSETPPGEIEKAIDQAQFFVGLQKTLNRLIWPVLVMIGGLMQNDLLFSNGMEEKLRDIWIPIRNLVNILFVVILVGIALYNVLGLGDENGQYSIKAALPKIIIGIIAINFSFLGIKVFLDAMNVITVSVFALPGQVSEGLENVIQLKDGDPSRIEFEEKLCAQMTGKSYKELKDKKLEQQIKDQEKALLKRFAMEYLGTSYVDATHGGMTENQLADAIKKSDKKGGAQKAEDFSKKVEDGRKGAFCTGGQLSDAGKLFLTRWDSRNAALAMAISMGQIIQYEEIHPEGLKDVTKLAISTIFSFAMYLVFTISFLALFIVLLARLVVMWLSIAISPVLLLIIAAPSLKEKMGGFNKVSDNFIKLAIAPIIIGLSMTIGWIMLNALRGVESFQTGTGLSMDPSGGIPVVGLSTIQDLTVALGTVAVIWLGVFGAAEGTIASTATDFLKDQAQRAGKFIGTLPLKHTPLIPVDVPGAEGKKFSMAELGHTLGELTNVGEQNRLTKLIKGEQVEAGTVKDTSKVANKEDFYKFLHSRGEKLTSAADLKNLEAISKGTLRKDLGLKGPELAALKAFVAEPNKEGAVNTLLTSTPGIKAGKGGLKLEGAAKPATGGGAAAAAGTVAAAQDVTGDTKVGGKSIEEHAGTEEAKQQDAVAAFKGNADTLKASLHIIGKKQGGPDATDTAKVKGMLAKLVVNPGTDKAQVPTTEELKITLGAGGYETLVSSFVDEDKLKVELETIQKDSRTPAPPIVGG